MGYRGKGDQLVALGCGNPSHQAAGRSVPVRCHIALDFGPISAPTVFCRSESVKWWYYIDRAAC